MNKLKFLREEKSLLQSDVAKIICVSPQAVGLYESGKRDLSSSTLIKLANFYGVTTDYILGISNVKEPSKKPLPIDSFNIEGLSKDEIKNIKIKITEIEERIEYFKWKHKHDKVG